MNNGGYSPRSNLARGDERDSNQRTIVRGITFGMAIGVGVGNLVFDSLPFGFFLGVALSILIVTASIWWKNRQGI